MVTPELLSYIRSTLAAGKTKDQIERDLMSGGGWKSEDIAEAFNTIQNPFHSPSISQTPFTVSTPAPAPAVATVVTVRKSGSSFFTKFLLTIIILGGIAYGATKFFGPQVNTLLAGITGTSTPAPTATDNLLNNTPATDNSVVVPVTTPVVDTTPVADTTTCADNDLHCLALAANTCTAASARNTVSTTTGGVTSTATNIYSVDGQQGTDCIFSVKRVSVALTPAAGISIPQSATTAASNTIGQQGTCVFTKNTDLITMLNNWQKGRYTAPVTSCKATADGTTCTVTGGDYAKASCSGEYFGTSPAV